MSPSSFLRVDDSSILPTLTVCMIVRDEEQVLLRSLESVHPIADELVVVDTGSQDSTVSIAKHFGAKVFHFQWCDDFSAARNAALKYASGDWILQMDADEKLLYESRECIKSRLLEPDLLCCLTICDNGPQYAGPRFCWVGRLFRNHPDVYYSRPYHESIQQSVDRLMAEEPMWQIRRDEHIVIRHYGYEPDVLENKSDRGLLIMESYVKRNPKDPYILTKLGNLYGGLSRYDKAKLYLERALQADPNSPEANYSLALTLKNTMETDAAVAYYIKTIAADPDFAEAYVGLGAVYLQQNMLNDAISTLERALTIRPDLVLAHSNLASAYRKQGNLVKAAHHCDRALELGGPIHPEIPESLKPYRRQN